MANETGWLQTAATIAGGPIGGLAATALGGIMAGQGGGLSLKTIRRRTKKQKEKQLGRMNQLYDASLSRKQEGLAAIRGAREDTLRESGRLLRTGQRQINEQAKAARGGVAQGLVGTGLEDSSVARAREAGVDQAAARSMDELFTNFAAFRGNQYAQYAEAEAQALSDLGEFYQMRYARETSDYWDPILATMTGEGMTQAESPSIDLSGLVGLFTG